MGELFFKGRRYFKTLFCPRPLKGNVIWLRNNITPWGFKISYTFYISTIMSAFQALKSRRDDMIVEIELRNTNPNPEEVTLLVTKNALTK